MPAPCGSPTRLDQRPAPGRSTLTPTSPSPAPVRSPTPACATDRVFVNGGGHATSPGNGVGKLNAGAETWAGGGTYEWEIADPSQPDAAAPGRRGTWSNWERPGWTSAPLSGTPFTVRVTRVAGVAVDLTRWFTVAHAGTLSRAGTPLTIPPTAGDEVAGFVADEFVLPDAGGLPCGRSARSPTAAGGEHPGHRHTRAGVAVAAGRGAPRTACAAGGGLAEKTSVAYRTRASGRQARTIQWLESGDGRPAGRADRGGRGGGQARVLREAADHHGDEARAAIEAVDRGRRAARDRARAAVRAGGDRAAGDVPLGEIGVPLVFEGNFSQDKFLDLAAGQLAAVATARRRSGRCRRPASTSSTWRSRSSAGRSRCGRGCRRRRRPSRNGDTLTVTLGFEKQQTAMITAILTTPFAGRVTVLGSEGWVEIRDRNHPEDPKGWDVTAVHAGPSRSTEFHPPHATVRDNIEEFARAAGGRRRTRSSLDEMLANVATFEAITRSAALGPVEPWDDAPRRSTRPTPGGNVVDTSLSESEREHSAPPSGSTHSPARSERARPRSRIPDRGARRPGARALLGRRSSPSTPQDKEFVARLRESVAQNAYALRDVLAGTGRARATSKLEKVLTFATVQAQLRIPQKSMQRSYRVSFFMQWEVWTGYVRRVGHRRGARRATRPPPC